MGHTIDAIIPDLDAESLYALDDWNFHEGKKDCHKRYQYGIKDIVKRKFKTLDEKNEVVFLFSHKCGIS